MKPKNMTNICSTWAVSTSKNLDVYLKMLCVDIQNCACYPHGEHMFRKIVKKGIGKWKNASEMTSDTSKCDEHVVRYTKVSLKWCKIHRWSHPRGPPVAKIHKFAKDFEVRLGGHGAAKTRKHRTTERWNRKTRPKYALYGPPWRRKIEIFG